MIHVTTTVNGDETEFVCDPRETLLDVLRDRLQLTGAKEGCGTGDCGACSVTLDGTVVCSCLVLGAEAEGKEIGAEIKLSGFARYALGEGIEKKEEDFAAEVAAATGG